MPPPASLGAGSGWSQQAEPARPQGLAHGVLRVAASLPPPWTDSSGQLPLPGPLGGPARARLWFPPAPGSCCSRGPSYHCLLAERTSLRGRGAGPGPSLHPFF